MGCEVIIEREGNVQVMRLEGSDFAMVQLADVRRHFQELLATEQPLPLALDTTGLELLGSCCLSGIIDIALGYRKRGLTVFLVEMRPAILDVFGVASLDSILPVYPSIAEGQASLEAKAS
jgi:anti-anti-sigma factor